MDHLSVTGIGLIPAEGFQRNEIDFPVKDLFEIKCQADKLKPQRMLQLDQEIHVASFRLKSLGIRAVNGQSFDPVGFLQPGHFPFQESLDIFQGKSFFQLPMNLP